MEPAGIVGLKRARRIFVPLADEFNHWLPTQIILRFLAYPENCSWIARNWKGNFCC
jgi:hypothetical protein